MARRRTPDYAKERRNDFLDMLMQYEISPSSVRLEDVERDDNGEVWYRNGLTHLEVISQALGIMIAGYETTLETFAFFCFAMAQNLDCQDRLYAELDEFFKRNGTNIESDSDKFVEDSKQLVYLDMCLSESLRLYSPVMRTDRTCTRETELGGFKVRKGVVVNIPICCLHSDPELWPDGEDLDKFDPERFSSDKGRDFIPSFAYMPFGLGNRMCLGMRLAQLELKTVIAYLFFNFRLTLSPKTKIPVPLLNSGFRRPTEGIWLLAEPR